MNEDCIFSQGHLLGVLARVIDSQGITGRSPYGPGVSATVQADGHESVRILIDFGAVAVLSRKLQVLTSVDVSGDVNYLAEIMAYVANIANKWGRIGSDVSTEGSLFNNKMHFDFCIACVNSLANAYGYEISEIIKNDEVSLGFIMQDWSRLKAEFQKILEASEVGDVRPEDLVPAHEQVLIGRKLSAESFWNLRSIAEQENWSYEDILLLIEEHLSPTLNPDLVYENNTVSGADWLRLHEWIRRGRR